MTTEASAEALVQEAPVETSIETEIDAIWQRHEAESKPVAETPVEDAPVEEPKKEPEVAEAEEKDEKESVSDVALNIPSQLPREVKQRWAEIPAEARDAIARGYQEMGDKVNDAHRLATGLKPVQDALVEAVRALPALRDMKPHEAAKSIAAAAQSLNAVMTNPEGAAGDFVRDYPDFAKAIASRVGGTPSNTNESAAMRQHIAMLERKLQQVSDPNYLHSQFEQFSTTKSVEQTINEFAASAEHWSDVTANEDNFAQAIAYVKATQPRLSEKDTLAAAYDLEVRRLGMSPRESAAEQAAPVVDTEKTSKALKAKSVNVKNQPTGKSKTMSEDEALEAVWRKYNS